MAHPNEDLIRRGYDAFSRGDMDAVRELLADDVVWHVPGRGPLAGDYRGIEEVLGFFARTFELTGGTFSIEVHTVLADDEHGVTLALVRGQREGRTLEDRQAHVAHVRDGKVREFWTHPGDQYATDEFWS